MSLAGVGSILNSNLPLLPSCWGVSFAFGRGVSPQSRSSSVQLLLQRLPSCQGFSFGCGVSPHSYFSATQPEPDILECEVKWALGSITMNKASGGDGIPVELFQILKDAAAKMLHSICQQIWKTQQWTQDWKRSVHSNPKERQCQRMLKLQHKCIHLSC